MADQLITENEKIKQSGKLSIKDGFFTGIMNGFGDRYVSAYALFLGSSNFLIALISTLPGLLGTFSQLFSIKLMKNYSRKKIVVLTSIIQAVLWIPLILIGISYYYFENLRFYSPIFLLVIYSSLIIIGSMGGPIWNSWMRDLVNVNKGKYFGIRNQILNIAIIISMLLAGVILNYFSKTTALIGFLIIFFIASIGRFISSSYLIRQYEPKFVYDKESQFNFKDFVSKMLFNNFGHFVLFISLISFATAISGPFFVVYQLKDLGLNYINFTLIILASVITTILFLPFWGIFSDKYGNVWVLRFTGWFIPLVPLLWIFSIFIKNNLMILIPYLIFIEFLSGFFWGGFNLAASNFIYDAVTKQRMAICVAYYNFITAIFTFAGSLLGTLLIKLNFHIGFLKGLLFIFLISGIARILTIAIMQSYIKEVKEVKDFRLRTHLKKQLKKTSVILWKYLGIKTIKEKV